MPRPASSARPPLSGSGELGASDGQLAAARPHATPRILSRARTELVRELARCKTETATCVSGAVAGVAPHVLHAGPLAGTGLVAGAGGQLLFGGLGFLATLPLLWRLHRRKGGWRAPAWALAAFSALFVLSALVIGPFIVDITQPEHSVTPDAEVYLHGHDR